MNYLSRHIFGLLFLLTLSLHTAVYASEGVHSIPFEKTSGLILIDAEVDGILGSFIFDTGSSELLINRTNDGKRSSKFETITGVFSGFEVKISSLMLGNYHLFDVPAFTSDLGKFEKLTGKRILGIIGGRFFKSDVLKIDNISKTIHIFPRKYIKNLKHSSQYKCPIIFENEVPLVTIDINGQFYKFALDTGSSICLIDNDFVKDNPTIFTSSKTQFQLVTAGDGQILSEAFTLNNLKFGAVNVKDLSFGTADFDSINSVFSNQIVGIISVDQLPFRELILDYDKGLLFFLL